MRKIYPHMLHTAAFFTFISAFPFILLLLTVIKYTPLTEQMLLASIEKLAPGVIEDTLVSWINELYSDNVGFMSLSIIIALWSASRGNSRYCKQY